MPEKLATSPCWIVDLESPFFFFSFVEIWVFMMTNTLQLHKLVLLLAGRQAFKAAVQFHISTVSVSVSFSESGRYRIFVVCLYISDIIVKCVALSPAAKILYYLLF